jgi:hypothetical protein
LGILGFHNVASQLKTDTHQISIASCGAAPRPADIYAVTGPLARVAQYYLRQGAAVHGRTKSGTGISGHDDSHYYKPIHRLMQLLTCRLPLAGVAAWSAGVRAAARICKKNLAIC